MEVVKNGETPIPIHSDLMAQNKFMEKLQKELNIQREKVLKLRLARHGIILNVEEESKCRFKKMVCEVKDGIETYYYNNGTREGIRIVSMEVVQKEIGDGKIEFQLKHY